jgi:hypothetical protein
MESLGENVSGSDCFDSELDEMISKYENETQNLDAMFVECECEPDFDNDPMESGDFEVVVEKNDDDLEEAYEDNPDDRDGEYYEDMPSDLQDRILAEEERWHDSLFEKYIEENKEFERWLNEKEGGLRKRLKDIKVSTGKDEVVLQKLDAIKSEKESIKIRRVENGRIFEEFKEKHAQYEKVNATLTSFQDAEKIEDIGRANRSLTDNVMGCVLYAPRDMSDGLAVGNTLKTKELEAELAKVKAEYEVIKKESSDFKKMAMEDDHLALAEHYSKNDMIQQAKRSISDGFDEIVGILKKRNKQLSFPIGNNSTVIALDILKNASVIGDFDHRLLRRINTLRNDLRHSDRDSRSGIKNSEIPNVIKQMLALKNKSVLADGLLL